MTAPARDCALCGATIRTVVFRQKFAAIDESTPMAGYDVVVCQRCGFGFADRIPDQETLDRYYRSMSKYEYSQRGGAESAYDARRLDAIADIVRAHLPSTELSVLDVGCASGRLLANLRSHGFDRVSGLDPSATSAVTANRLYGVTVRTMPLGELPATGERFDVVLMVGVLEHIRDLERTFVALSCVVPTGGYVYVEVPDVTAFADWSNAPYQDFSVEHINFFSPDSLTNLLRRYGWQPVFVEQNHREQSFRTVMSNISAMFRLENVAFDDVPHDPTTLVGLNRYILRSAEEDASLQAKIDTIVDAGRPLVVWGVGTHTSRLMATSRLRRASIVAFVESNARYHGKMYLGRPIMSPDGLRQRSEPVLISSRVFQKEIADQIRRDLACDNELILLYDV